MPRGELRRKDRELNRDETWGLLTRAFSGRLGTASPDGWPYVVPQLFIVHDEKVYFHSTAAQGHTRSNVEANAKVCFEIDEPGFIFPSGDDAQCETSVGFESVVLFGTCRIIEDRQAKIAFYERFMEKYADPAWVRPQAWPLLDATTVYEITVDRLTGKRRPVAVADKWKHLFPEN